MIIPLVLDLFLAYDDDIVSWIYANSLSLTLFFVIIQTTIKSITFRAKIAIRAMKSTRATTQGVICFADG